MQTVEKHFLLFASACSVPESLFLCSDLSLNPMVNISDTTFQGFLDLNYM